MPNRKKDKINSSDVVQHLDKRAGSTMKNTLDLNHDGVLRKQVISKVFLATRDEPPHLGCNQASMKSWRGIIQNSE